MINRLQGGRKIWGRLGKLWKDKTTSKETKMVLYERREIPAIVYDSETQKRRKLEVFMMMCLRNIGNILCERGRNSVIREGSRCELNVLKSGR